MFVPEITATTMESASIIMAALDAEAQTSKRLAKTYSAEPALKGYYLYRSGRCIQLRDEMAHQFEALWDAEVGTLDLSPESLAIPRQDVQ